MSSRTRAVVVCGALILAGTALTGCQSATRALGLAPQQPDEFRILAKAPLVIPPDYGLRPPAPGEPRPQELQPESRAREAIAGRRLSEARSDGEKLLVSKAGADRADPLIRYVIDDEYGDITYKDRSFAEKVLFWRGAPAPTVQTPTGPVTIDPASNTPTPVDPAAEQRRIAAATGGAPVMIRRDAPPKRKLPGL